MMSTTECRIYVASLSDYNAGVLHGIWIDDCSDVDEMQEQIAAMLRESKHPNVEVECPDCEGCDDDCETCGGTGKVPSAEEWAIHDREGFGSLIGEYSNLEEVATHAAMIEEHGDAWIAYCGMVGEDYATEEGFKEAYCGQWDSEEDYAESLIDDCYNLEELMGSLAIYFDYEEFARDLFMCDYWRDDDTGHVFRRY